MPESVRFDRPIAHRGLHSRAAGVIENSRSAFELAIAGGYGIECDLQLTRDGVAVLMHDDRLARLTGLPGFIRDIDSTRLCATPLLGSAVGDCPQHLVDFLVQIRGRTLLQIELKAQKGNAIEALAAVTASALASYTGPVTIESFEPQLLIAIRRAGFAGPLGIIVERYAGDGEVYGAPTPVTRFARRHLLHWPWTRFDFISCDKTALDLPAVRWWAGRGMPLTAWTIRSPGEAIAARRSGAQIVFEGFDPQP